MGMLWGAWNRTFGRYRSDLISAAGVIAYQQVQMRELQRANLTQLESSVAIAEAWLLSLEVPEVDVRESVLQMAEALRNDLARLQEHVV